MANTQRRFAVLGENTFKIVNRLMRNQTLCRLLVYADRDPLSPDKDDINGDELLHNYILISPRIPDEQEEQRSFTLAIFENYVLNKTNTEFKLCTIRFDVACPYEQWDLNENSLRPYLIMQEIDNMFNQKSLSGIGNLEFISSSPLTLTRQLAGYSMRYKINEFN